jgi:hypothetical protein
MMVKSEDVLTNDQTFFKTKDGAIARKGTIAAAVLNSKYLEDLMSEPQTPTRDTKIKNLVQDIHSLIPGIHALNLFQFFSPIEWLQQKPNLREGRVFIAVLYLQRHPELVDPEIISTLEEIKHKTHLELRLEIDKLLSDHAYHSRRS